MLVSLHVKNLALIDESEVYFTEGLNILTGETGAGKSIIVGSVNLALGAKADKDYIRQGAEYALVELLFALNEKQNAFVAAMDLPVEEDQTLILQRKIMQGRSVCKVNGETVSSGQVRQLAGILLDIHGQNEHQSLLKPAKHKEILDNYAGSKVQEKKHLLKAEYEEYQNLKKEREEADSDDASRQRELSLISFEINEIEEARLIPGEDEQLEKDYRKMINAKKINEAVYTAYGFTCEEQDTGASQNISRALREIKSVTAYDEEMESMEAQLQDIDSLLNDFNHSIASYLERMQFDEEVFVQTETRLNLLNHLKSKYGNSIEAVLAYGSEKQERLEKLNDYENYLANLEQKLAEKTKQILELCEKISKERQKAAASLSLKLQEALVDLNFLNVNFEIQVTPVTNDFHADGYDKIEFMISTNPGEAMKPLWQVASGGELSRIMLAFKTVLADEDDIYSLIFDEIDAGISGKTAWKVSEKLGVLSRNHQIICITHLPQIAAMADSHYVISKQTMEGRTFTQITKMNQEESVMELARLLGGEQITEAVLTNAKEMKDLAVKTKKN